MLPIVIILAWWIRDLQYHWRSLAEYHYGWIVLILAGYLAWERWILLSPAPSPSSRFGISVALAGVGTPFIVVSELYKQAIGETPAASFCLAIGCVLHLFANGLYSFGWGNVRQFCFPLLFFCTAVPVPGVIWGPIVQNLKILITSIDEQALNLLGIPALQHGSVIRLPGCMVGIDEACSGIRSFQSSLMAGLFIGGVTFNRRSDKVRFFAAALALALIGNVFRSICLSCVAHCYGIEALHRFHDAAGWSVFAFTTLSLAALAFVIPRK